ncbi:MAG: AraC family transcriptional regulator [Lachnospiraceae bacterium]|nr:AraC family transcriptional regulator [Lachnospiraceae bacterium]
MESVRYDINTGFTLEKHTIQVLSFMCGTFSKSVAAHSHGADCYEIHYIPEGYGLLRADGMSYELKPGTLYITGPHILHEQIPAGTDSMQEYCIYLKLKNAPDKGAPFPILDIFKSYPFFISWDHPEFHIIFRQILAELSERNTGFRYQLQNLYSQLLISIVREYEKGKGKRPQTETLMQADRKVMLMDDYFLYEYRNLSLQTLADLLCLSTRQTQRLLQSYYGKSFQEKKTQARMSNAAVLLKDGKMRIAEIAEYLGYSSPEQFSTAFKGYYGVTPSKFREEG